MTERRPSVRSVPSVVIKVYTEVESSEEDTSGACNGSAGSDAGWEAALAAHPHHYAPVWQEIGIICQRSMKWWWRNPSMLFSGAHAALFCSRLRRPGLGGRAAMPLCAMQCLPTPSQLMAPLPLLRGHAEALQYMFISLFLASVYPRLGTSPAQEAVGDRLASIFTFLTVRSPLQWQETTWMGESTVCPVLTHTMTKYRGISTDRTA